MSSSSAPPPAPPSPVEPELQALVEQRLAVYTGLLTPGHHEAMRRFALDALEAHPNLRPWLDVLRERESRSTTGEEPKEHSADGAVAALGRRGSAG
jgi:hypothetical protein